MKFFLLLLASIFISLAWLLPIHYRPWVTYTGELYAFFALFALAAIFLKEKLIIPKISLPLLALTAIPFIQWACGLLFFFDKARSEEHTSELQSRPHLVCRLLLEKKK